MDYIKQVDVFAEWLEGFDCIFQIKIHTEEGMMTWHGGAGRPKRTPPLEKESEHADKWRWQCYLCKVEYFVEDYRWCPKCGGKRPSWIGTEMGHRVGELERWRQSLYADPVEMKQKFEGLDSLYIPKGECVGEVRFEAHTCGLKHWGLWSEKSGWWSTPSRMQIWSTRDRALAYAQLDVVDYHGRKEDHKVRCIEEWFDTEG